MKTYTEPPCENPTGHVYGPAVRMSHLPMTATNPGRLETTCQHCRVELVEWPAVLKLPALRYWRYPKSSNQTKR